MSDFGYVKRPNPPKEMSFITFVEREWDAMRPHAQKGRDVSLRISIVERELKKGRAALEAGELRAGLDWASDLTVAEDHHTLNLRWLAATNNNNSIAVQLWRDLAKKQSDLSTAMMVNGVNLIVAGHGAAAIAALNALVSEHGDRYRVAMITTIIAACMGITLVALGKILVIEWLSHISNKVANKLAYPSPRRLEAVGKYVERVSARPSKAATWLIYGSIIWFAIYIFFALVLILNS